MVMKNLFKYINHLLIDPDLDETANDISEITNSVDDVKSMRHMMGIEQIFPNESTNNIMNAKSFSMTFPKKSSAVTTASSAPLAMAYSRFAFQDYEAGHQAPLIIDNISLQYHCPIVFTLHKLKSYLSHHQPTKQQYERKESFSKTLKVKRVSSPHHEIIRKTKQQQTCGKVAVVEETFSKEVLYAYYIGKSNNILILNSKIHQKYTQFATDSCQTDLLMSNVCLINRKIHDTHSIIKYSKTPTNTRYISFKSDNDNVLFFITTTMLFRFLSTETVQILAIDKYPVNFFYKLERSHLVSSVKCVAYLNESNFKLTDFKGNYPQLISNDYSMKFKSWTKTFNKDKHSSVIPSISVSMFDNDISMDLTMKSSSLPEPFVLSYEDKRKDHESVMISKKESIRLRLLSFQKTLAYSLPKHIYVKYNSNTSKLQNLSEKPMVKVITSNDMPSSLKFSSDINQYNSYNAWLLTSFLIGLTKSKHEIIKDFQYKFSLYVTEDDNCHDMFMDFFNIDPSRLTKLQFQQWCMEKCQYNTIELFDQLQLRLPPHQTEEHVLKTIANKCNCVVTISDRFHYADYGIFRAIQFVGSSKKSVLSCIRYFFNKIK